MSDVVLDQLVTRVKTTHGWLLNVTEALADEEFSWRPSPTAPPIGWHLWHIARWADRLQASFNKGSPRDRQRPDPNKGIWEHEGLVADWGLKADTLGVLEAGSGMDHDNAASIARMGMARHLEYARRTFAAVEDVIDALDLRQFEEPRESILQFRIDGNDIIPSPGPETTAAGDIVFHISHASRHLGMIEALRGAQGLRGTATV